MFRAVTLSLTGEEPTRCIVIDKAGEKYVGYVYIDSDRLGNPNYPIVARVYSSPGSKDNSGCFREPKEMMTIVFSPSSICPSK